MSETRTGKKGAEDQSIRDNCPSSRAWGIPPPRTHPQPFNTLPTRRPHPTQQSVALQFITPASINTCLFFRFESI